MNATEREALHVSIYAYFQWQASNKGKQPKSGPVGVTLTAEPNKGLEDQQQPPSKKLKPNEPTGKLSLAPTQGASSTIVPVFPKNVAGPNEPVRELQHVHPASPILAPISPTKKSDGSNAQAGKPPATSDPSTVSPLPPGPNKQQGMPPPLPVDQGMSPPPGSTLVAEPDWGYSKVVTVLSEIWPGLATPQVASLLKTHETRIATNENTPDLELRFGTFATHQAQLGKLHATILMQQQRILMLEAAQMEQNATTTTTTTTTTGTVDRKRKDPLPSATRALTAAQPANSAEQLPWTAREFVTKFCLRDKQKSAAATKSKKRVKEKADAPKIRSLKERIERIQNENFLAVPAAQTGYRPGVSPARRRVATAKSRQQEVLIPHTPPLPRPPSVPSVVAWEARYLELVDYHKGHGHCRAPPRSALGNWVMRQRSMKKIIGEDLEANNGKRVKTVKAQLSEERIERLTKMDFEWKMREPSVPWELRYEQLKIFKEEHGHCRVSRVGNGDTVLGEWVHNQRGTYKKKGAAIQGERTQLLEEIGFDWNPGRHIGTVTKTFDERIEDLMGFRRKHGHLDIPAPLSPPHSARAYSTQKTAAKKDSGVTEMGDDESVSESESNEIDGVSVEGGEKAENKGEYYTEDQSFFRWVIRIKQEYNNKYILGKKSTLTVERIKKLEHIGFNWESGRLKNASGVRPGKPKAVEPWNAKLKELEQYQEEHGDTAVPRECAQNKKLGVWVANQRKQYNKLMAGKRVPLDQDRIQALENMGFKWVIRPWMTKRGREAKQREQEAETESLVLKALQDDTHIM